MPDERTQILKCKLAHGMINNAAMW